MPRREAGLRAGGAGGRALFRWAKFSFVCQKRTRKGSRACARGRALLHWGYCSLLMSKENQKTTSDFDALDPRERGCSPLSDPEGVVETEKS